MLYMMFKISKDAVVIGSIVGTIILSELFTDIMDYYWDKETRDGKQTIILNDNNGNTAIECEAEANEESYSYEANEESYSYIDKD